MKVLAYSPSCEAYVECKTKGGARRYDLSGDIVSMQVNRVCDGSSTFSLTLQNKDWKYNGLFTPMDKIVLYATKEGRHKLLSGFITDCDVFSLYQKDITLKGRCVLYRVEKLYWDPGVTQSYFMLSDARVTNKKWAGYAQTIYDLLTKVGGWDESRIMVGEIPDDALAFAREMYHANADSADQLRNMANEFYEVLQTHGVKGSTAGGSIGGGNLGGSDGQRAVCELYMSWEGKFAYSQASGRTDPVANGYGDCSSTIWRAYMDKTGIDVGTWTGAMVGNGTTIATGSGSNLPISEMQPADLVLFNWNGYNSNYDHVEMYMGDNKFMGHGGPGNGPYWKQDACAYASSASDWMVRRYL